MPASASGGHLDLFILVADKDMEFALKGILGRPERLRIRRISYQVAIHPQRDPGVRKRCHAFLRPFVGSADHVLVMLDREGCGDPARREEIEADIEGRLAVNGWSQRCAAIALDPELEVWAWSDSPHVPRALGWDGTPEEFKDWLANEGRFASGDPKPRRPKETLDAVLRRTQKRRSSAIFLEIASKVSFERCTDPAFEKLQSVLRGWFPV